MALRSGLESFFQEPGQTEKMQCKVCGSECTVSRNILTATSHAAALAVAAGDESVKRNVDHFFCPHAEEEWHTQALKMKEKIDDNPFPTLDKTMREDLREHIRKHIGF